MTRIKFPCKILQVIAFLQGSCKILARNAFFLKQGLVSFRLYTTVWTILLMIDPASPGASWYRFLWRGSRVWRCVVNWRTQGHSSDEYWWQRYLWWNMWKVGEGRCRCGWHRGSGCCRRCGWQWRRLYQRWNRSQINEGQKCTDGWSQRLCEKWVGSLGIWVFRRCPRGEE